MTTRMPAVFLGHGSPMNAIEDNRWSQSWRELGLRLPRPRAVLCISAHWETEGVAVASGAQPETIHDFRGFPPALFEVRYPAPGSPALAERVRAAVRGAPVRADADYGLDHGSWCPLALMYPQADIPVVQLSLWTHQPGDFHYALGRELAALRDEGVLILGSGNIVHNLRTIDFQSSQGYDWAQRIDRAMRAHLLAGTHEALIEPARLDSQIALAIPTPEHYLPLLYVLGAQQPGDSVRLFNEGCVLGSIAMTSVVIGEPAATP